MVMISKKEKIDNVGFTVACIGSWLTIIAAAISAFLYVKWQSEEQDAI
jgi:hypothetical protein